MGADASSISDMSMYWQSVVGIADMAYCCSAARLSCGHPCLSTVCARVQQNKLSESLDTGLRAQSQKQRLEVRILARATMWDASRPSQKIVQVRTCDTARALGHYKPCALLPRARGPID